MQARPLVLGLETLVNVGTTSQHPGGGLLTKGELRLPRLNYQINLEISGLVKGTTRGQRAREGKTNGVKREHQ